MLLFVIVIVFCDFISIFSIMEDEDAKNILENNTKLSCGHCSRTMGTLKEIVDLDLAARHVCLLRAQHVQIDFEKKTVLAEQKQNDTGLPQPVAGCSKEKQEISKPQADRLEVQALANVTPETQWSDASIMLLIDTYKDLKQKFNSPLYNKKKVWELISQFLAKQGVFKSATKCDEKWRNLKKMHEKVLSEKNSTGNSAIFWKFFEDLHDIYFKDPRFQPVATFSSSGAYKRRADSENSDENEKSGSESNLSFEKKRVRAISAFDLDVRKQKRHDEKMQLKREMFDWFKENHKKTDKL